MSRQLGLQLDPIMDTGGVQFPVKRGTWDFIENAWNEGIKDSIKSLIGDNFDNHIVYILYGCVLTSSAGTTTISQGAVFSEGEIFEYPGDSFPDPVGTDVVIANLVQTSWQPVDSVGNQYADPVNFIGSSPANVHIIRTVAFATGASGSGTLRPIGTSSDYDNLVAFNRFTSTGMVLQSTWSNTALSLDASYKICGGSQCFLSGLIVSSAALPTAVNAIQLPFTILNPVDYVGVTVWDGATPVILRLSVTIGGLVKINGTTTNPPGVNLEGVSFRIN